MQVFFLYRNPTFLISFLINATREVSGRWSEGSDLNVDIDLRLFFFNYYY